MTKPLTFRQHLDWGRCNDPDCTEDHGPLLIHSRCHPEAPTWAEYDKGGELRILCSECDDTIVRIAVAG